MLKEIILVNVKGYKGAVGYSPDRLGMGVYQFHNRETEIINRTAVARRMWRNTCR
jgi:hypothetical protein